MKEFQRITILLKESIDDEHYNKRIIEYLNDRHQEINNVGYAIAIEVVDDGNISKYIKSGVSSTPALMIETNIEYGVNSIIATLAKLELAASPTISKFSGAEEDEYATAHHKKILEEMHSGEPDDENTPSTVKLSREDSEAPMSDRDREARMSKFDAVYKDRMKNNPMNKFSKSAPTNAPTAKRNVDKLIESKGYDAAEAAFMREIAKNLD